MAKRNWIFVVLVMAIPQIAVCAVDVMAVYYPHWHVYPKGNEWFHPGWTEWEYVREAMPRFPGHRQPIVPQTGYLDGKNPVDVAREIDLAANAGIGIFLYDYYYYGGKVTQEEAIEEGFLKAPNRNRIKFALMWCYHDRGFAWRRKIFAEDRNFVMKLERTSDEFLGLIDLSIKRYFRTPEYWRRNGKLFFSIYAAGEFVKSVGDAAAKDALLEARRRIRTAGLGEVEFNAQNPGSLDEAERFRNVGFDSLTHYSGKPVPRLDERYADGERRFDYGEVGPELGKRYAEYAKAGLPYYPSVSAGWDSTPRCRQEEPFPWRGTEADYPYTMTLTNCTASLLEKNLRQAKSFAEQDSKHPGVVYINAWNEYTEGCYLLPDNFEGDARLRAVRRVFGEEDAECGPCVTKRISYNQEHGEFGMGDLYYPKAFKKDSSVVLAIHGGGWSSGSRKSWEGVADFFVRELGLPVFNINYRLKSEQAKWPASGDDCITAAQFLLSEDFTRISGLAPRRIWLCGGSAGGHLALWAGLSLPAERVAGIVAISCIGDPAIDAAVHPDRYRFMYSSDGSLLNADPQTLIGKDGPRILLTHARGDNVVPIESAIEFARTYRQFGNHCEFFSYPTNVVNGLTGHCIWQPESEPRRLIWVLEQRIRDFITQ